MTFSAGAFMLFMAGLTPLEERIDAILRSRPIVRATVTQIGDLRDAARLTSQTIDRVYCGSGTLVGASFDERSIDRLAGGGSRGFPPLVPPLTLGESGIFFLREIEGQRLIRFLPPARPNVTERYEAFVSLAAAAEDLWRLPTEAARLDLLSTLVRDSTPEIATWAAGIMGETYPEELARMARDWERNGISAGAITALDEALCRANLPADQWQGSPQRAALLMRAAEAGASGEIEISRLLDYLGFAIQRRQIDPALLMALLTPIVDNPRLPIAPRRYALGLLHYIINEETVGSAIVDRLLAAMERAKAPDASEAEKALAQTAVGTIEPLQKATEEQRVRLGALRDAAQAAAAIDPSERNPAVREARILTEVVRRVSARPATQPSP